MEEELVGVLERHLTAQFMERFERLAHMRLRLGAKEALFPALAKGHRRVHHHPPVGLERYRTIRRQVVTVPGRKFSVVGHLQQDQVVFPSK